MTFRIILFSLLAWTSILSPTPVPAGDGDLVRSDGYSLTDTRMYLRAEAPADSTGSSDAGGLGIRLDTATDSNREPTERTSAMGSLAGSLSTTIGGLAITLGVFAMMVLIMRKLKTNQSVRGLPREAFEVIGQTSIGPKQQLMVVRCGLQAIVIGVSPAGIQTVAQFDDPDEAGQLIAQCRGLGTVAAFSSTLREIEREQPARGFVASETDSRPKGKLFLRA